MSTVVIPDGLTTITYDVRDYVAQVTLNRPEMHNAFNERMQDELAALWRHIRLDDAVRVVVLTGAGDQAFCTGIDRGDIPVDEEFDPFTYDDPGQKIGPKSQGLWKPVIAAVNGMACGGGFYLLGESDIIVAAEHATFFDPHVSFTMTAVYEPILLTNRMAFGDLVRMSLVGLHERMSARTARETGLVSDVVPSEKLLDSTRALAEVIASQPPTSVQATLRTLWAVRGLSREQALGLGNVFLQLGTSAQALQEGQEFFSQQKRGEWKLR
jgi:enoyl-CoA hydratase/carnithine racemase